MSQPYFNKISPRADFFLSQIMGFVESCKSDTNDGYGPTIKHDSHLLYTLSAIQIAAERNTLDKLDKEKLVNYIKSLQQEDGSFVGTNMIF